MKLISYYDKYSAENGKAQYLTLDIDSGTEVESPAESPLPDIDGTPAYKFGSSSDGKYTYIAAFKYTLRDDMERKIRRRLFRKDNETGELEEMFTKWDRSGLQMNNYTFIKENIFFTVASFDYNTNVVYTADISESIDGSNVKEMWRTNGYPYGWHMNPDKTMMAFHIAGGNDEFNPHNNYAINTMDLDGNRKYICSEQDHLFFGPKWSPDGKMIMFQDCVPKDNDPGHHFSDIVVCNADGSDLRRVTEGRVQYFGTSFGLEGHRMGGSSCPIWTPDSKIICNLMMPGSHPDCHFDETQRNHEELIYDPSMGKGGCCLVLLDPVTGEKKHLTEMREGCWDFRPHSLSADGKELLYTHSEFGKSGEIRLLNLETGDIKVITNGTNELGADHAKFI